MQNFAEFHLKPESLERYGLPDIPYPIPAADLRSALLDDRELPLAVILHGQQQGSWDGAAQWRRIAPAMDRLAELLAPDDTRELISSPAVELMRSSEVRCSHSRKFTTSDAEYRTSPPCLCIPFSLSFVWKRDCIDMVAQ